MPEAPGPAGLLAGRRPAISAVIVNELSAVPAGPGRPRWPSACMAWRGCSVTMGSRRLG